MRELIKNSRNILLRRQTNILSAAFIIMITYAGSHIIGLLKTRILISLFFGAKAATLDVYYAAFVIPDTIFQLLVIGSLSAAFIPVFTKLLHHNEDKAWQVASTSLTLVFSVFLAISVLIFIFALPLCKLIAPGFDASQLALMTSLLKVMLFAQLFFCISGFLTGIIQSHQRFVIPALAPIVYNLGIILGAIFLSPFIGIYGPAVGVVIGAALHMGIQIPFAYKLGFRPRIKINMNDPYVKEIAGLISPRALALGIDQVEQFIAVILASALASGSLTMFNVARLLYALPGSLFGVTIGQAALPTLAQQSAQGARQEFSRTITSSLQQILFLALPLSVIFITLRIPVVRLVFGATSFPWLATITTGKVLAVLTASAAFSAMNQLAVRGFYALHNTRTPLMAGIFSAGLNVFLSLLLVKGAHMETVGLALAISISTIFETIILLVFLSRRLNWDSLLVNDVFREMTKMVITSIITGISLWVPMRLLDQFVFDTTRTLPLIWLTAITTLIGIVVYLLLSYFFRVKELKSFWMFISRLSSVKLALPQSREPLIIPAPEQN